MSLFGRRARLAWSSVAFLSAFSFLACAPAAEQDESTADAVTAAEVLPEGASTIFTGEPAASRATEVLGVRDWQGYVVNAPGEGMMGTLVLGTDERGQVAYAIAAASGASRPEEVSVTFLRFDAKGVAADQALDERTHAALASEAGRLAERLTSFGSAADVGIRSGSPGGTSRLRDGVICGAGVVAGLLVGAAALKYGTLAAIAVVSVGAGDTLGTALLAHVFVRVAPVVAAPVGATLLGVEIPRYASVAWEGYKRACRNAATGNPSPPRSR